MILDPHIGHLYTAVLADAKHRWKLLKGGKRLNERCAAFCLSTGTDEHGIKAGILAQYSMFLDSIGRPFGTQGPEELLRLLQWSVSRAI